MWEFVLEKSVFTKVQNVSCIKRCATGKTTNQKVNFSLLAPTQTTNINSIPNKSVISYPVQTSNESDILLLILGHA